MLFAGLWFGTKSPVMNTFLKPYTKSLLVLEKKGNIKSIFMVVILNKNAVKSGPQGLELSNTF
jgi:hypothetical protein